MKRYYKHSIKNSITVKNLMTLEYLELSKEYIHTAESHNFWEIAYVDKGILSYEIEGKSITLKAGELLFLSPNQTHAIAADGKSATNIFVLCFECLSPIMNAFSNYKANVSSDTKFYLAKIIDECYGTYKMPFNKILMPLPEPNFGGEQAIKAYIELLLIHLLRKNASHKILPAVFLNNEHFANEMTNIIIQYLKENLYSNMTIEKICKNFNYSKSFLSKTFKKCTNKTIIEYYNVLKIEESKKMLRETGNSVSKISDILKFSDPRYFIYLFKKITTMTPKQYKNSIKKLN